MEIVVLTKHVPRSVGDASFAADHTLDRAAVRCRLQDPDEYALDQASRIAARRLDVHVTALTMGPADATATLHAALARGADEAVHILDDALHGSDAPATSLVLAAACRRAGFDLILCGAASSDGRMAVVPPMLAERLGIPALCFADSLVTDDERIQATRDDGVRTEHLTARMPAVVSVTDRGGEPRSPRFEAVREARQKLVRTWSLADLGIDPARVGLRASATRVHATRRHLQNPVPRVDGRDPAAAAVRIADFLTERQFL